jgi:protoheme IX farnesyltransferase
VIVPVVHADATGDEALAPSSDREPVEAERLRPPGLAADLLTLTKPRITTMVLITMMGGAFLAGRVGHVAHGAQARGWTTASLLMAVVGTALIVSGANTLNMYLERDSDRLMARTRNRPLPTGRMTPSVALLVRPRALGGLRPAAHLRRQRAHRPARGPLAGELRAHAYTPLKRKTTLSLLIGAVPGAIPPLMGWTAVTGRIEWPGVLLFGVMFLWQIPHFLAIATFRRDDYRRAGLKVLPVERGDRVTRHHIVAYLAALVLVTLLLVPLGVGGSLYLGAALLLGAGFFGFGAWGLRASAGVRWARGLFVTSIVYLVLLLSALMVSA